MKEKLSKDRLIQLLSKLTQPESDGLSEADARRRASRFLRGLP